MHNENEILDNEVLLDSTDTSHEIVHEVTIYAEPIGHIGNFTITNALLTSWIAVGIIVILAIVVRLSIKKVPSKLQTLFEVIIEQTLDLTDQITSNRAKSLKIFPIALSVFFFILINNWLGILPLGAFGLVAEHGGESAFLPFLRSGTADINTTLALAVMAVLGSNLFGILSIGAWKTFNKYVNLKALGKVFTDVRKDPSTLMVAPVMFFVGILELVGEAAKVASLSFRLFGNVFAGEVLLASMAALLAYVLPIPFLGLEIFVGLIQALIFSMLTLVYFSIASENHDEAHAEKH
jgi:F-type H+-transporting ATPase subunit a